MALASAAVPAAASEVVAMRFECRASAGKPNQAPQLAGLWDVLMDVGGVPSFGLLSVAMSGTELAGSLALNAGVVVVRSLTLVNQSVTMIVASGEGDVRFDGSLASDGKRMCGIVSYHGGQKFEMVAQKRAGREGARSE
jgi:hypothetical protein